MNRFKWQLLNDYRLNKKNLWTPMIVFLVIDFLAIIAFFILKSKLGLDTTNIMSFDIDLQNEEILQFPKTAWYLLGMGVLGIAGFIQVLVSLSIGNQSLNLEKYRKCEIFYRSQPISIWLYSLSKYIIAIAGPILILILIGLINLVLVIPLIAPLVTFSLFDALSGLGISILLYSRSILVMGSIGFLISAIFKEKAFLKLVLIIVSLQVLITIAHFSIDTPMFNIIDYITRLINPLGGFEKVMDNSNIESIMDIRQNLNIQNLLFNWHTALQIFASGLFFVSGVLIYGTKEVN